jgi:hypothetical protein
MKTYNFHYQVKIVRHRVGEVEAKDEMEALAKIRAAEFKNIGNPYNTPDKIRIHNVELNDLWMKPRAAEDDEVIVMDDSMLAGV